MECLRFRLPDLFDEINHCLLFVSRPDGTFEFTITFIEQPNPVTALQAQHGEEIVGRVRCQTELIADSKFVFAMEPGKAHGRARQRPSDRDRLSQIRLTYPDRFME